MTNDEFLKKAFSMAHFLSGISPNQMISIKGCDSTHLYCSEYSLQLMGATESEIIGKTVWFPLYDHNPDIEKIIREEDLSILESRMPKMVFKINRFTTGLTPYVCSKAPLINQSTNQVVGILFQGFEMNFVNFQQYLLKYIFLSNNNSSIHTLPSLSKREKQVVFLFMAHLSSREIANTLYQIEKKQISKSGVDTLFYDQLYPKFNVRSRHELYKKLQDMGYNEMIPEEILISSSMPLSKINIY
ncbi:MAG: hypothetical protein A3F11_10240 [Gammaproteobacteria bacterium RIFCSPHIGHO2_12_FULL_37_14]|nr:MAG: hypothetical protein A3F11_10240 [Gammaproteobacteria bacterium RIFCSPHIGHO2_12_FULL_37_14]